MVNTIYNPRTWGRSEQRRIIKLQLWTNHNLSQIVTSYIKSYQTGNLTLQIVAGTGTIKERSSHGSQIKRGLFVNKRSFVLLVGFIGNPLVITHGYNFFSG